MMDNLDNLIKANNAFEIIKSAFDNEEIGLPKFLDAAHKYNDIIKAGDPSHGGKLIKKVIINKMGKKETTWVKRGDEGNDKENGNKAANEPVKHSHKVLSAFAAETPEAKLKEVINTSTDEKLRKAAHAELDRRNKKEKPQEEKKETAKKKDKVEPKKESTKESKAEKKESEPSIDFKDQKLMIDGKDTGTFKFTKLDDKTIEIDKLYINKENQKGGLGKKVMQKLFDDNLKIDQLKVYPLATSEPFWARFAESMDKEGCFIITRKSLQQGIDKYSKTKK